MSFVDGSARLTLEALLDGWIPYDNGLLLHDPGGPGECLVRRGELITGPEYLDPLVTRLRRWVDTVHHDESVSLARVRLKASEHDRCVEIARDTAGAFPGVSANHVHLGSAVMLGTPVLFGTGGDAEPTPPMPEPEKAQWKPPIVVGVLDTGLDPHPWFASRTWFEPEPEVLDADDDSGQDRQAGHGTFVGGVVLQHAPGVILRPQRVLSSLGFSDDLTVAAGLRALRQSSAARGEQVRVVVLTSGCHTADDLCPPVLRAELECLDGVVVVAAAGNFSTTRPFWPAALTGVIGVAALADDGRLADFSNTGEWVDAAAPGVDVVSSHVHLRTSNNGEPRRYGFARWSGTSFAAPRVAAEVAAELHAGHEPAGAAEIACRRYSFGG